MRIMQFRKSLLATILLSILIHIKCNSEWWENSKVVELTNENFSHIVGKDKYVVIKFFTKWCYYCQKLSPVYDKLFDYYQGKRDDLIIARLECGQNKLIALKYDKDIPSYPTVGFFNPHSMIMASRFKNNRTFKNLVSWIKELLPK